MDTLKALPIWEFNLMVAIGAVMIVSSLFLLSRGVFMPMAAVFLVLFLLYMAYVRLEPDLNLNQAPDSSSQFDLFRDLEPADQTRVNPWVGYLQEDVSVNRTGPIGDFSGNDDSPGNAKMYEIQ